VKLILKDLAVKKGITRIKDRGLGTPIHIVLWRSKEGLTSSRKENHGIGGASLGTSGVVN